MLRRIVGLVGYAGSGKDEVGRILCRDHGFHRAAFADEMKRRALDAGWNGRKDDEGRRFLQEFGMFERAKDPDVWVDVVLAQIIGCHDDVVVTDVRLANEILMLRALGDEGRNVLRLWRVTRPGIGPANDHVSEHEWRPLSDGASVIANDGTLDALAVAVAIQLHNSFD